MIGAIVSCCDDDDDDDEYREAQANHIKPIPTIYRRISNTPSYYSLNYRVLEWSVFVCVWLVLLSFVRHELRCHDLIVLPLPAGRYALFTCIASYQGSSCSVQPIVIGYFTWQWMSVLTACLLRL